MIIYIVSVIACALMYLIVGNYLHERKYGSLSRPSRRLIDEFLSLDEKNRPFGLDEFKSALAALDAKADGRSRLDDHFREWSRDVGRRFSWTHGCTFKQPLDKPQECPYKEHLEFHRAFVKITEAEEERAKREKIEKVQDGLDSVPVLLERAQVEHKILTENTKEHWG